jgi:hypothetical protein
MQLFEQLRGIELFQKLCHYRPTGNWWVGRGYTWLSLQQCHDERLSVSECFRYLLYIDFEPCEPNRNLFIAQLYIIILFAISAYQPGISLMLNGVCRVTFLDRRTTAAASAYCNIRLRLQPTLTV